MEMTVNTRNVTLTPELKSYIQRKLGKFDSKLDNIMETRIEVIEEPTRSSLDRTVIRVSLSGANLTLHAEERAENVLTAVDRAFDSINKQIDKQKGKWQGKDKGGQSIRVESSEASPAAGRKRIAQTTNMGIRPMSLSEALAEADLLKDELFVFIDTDSGDRAAILRRRADGRYDLIRTELE
ncbi:MAG: ribosome-associated translation inhibitor RaiA [Dehalococcoidia bacterium]|nr:MAG: ribosome-associated translation inhibitor RaiA [Dehalococcoidia bacterium]